MCFSRNNARASLRFVPSLFLPCPPPHCCVVLYPPCFVIQVLGFPKAESWPGMGGMRHWTALKKMQSSGFPRRPQLRPVSVLCVHGIMVEWTSNGGIAAFPPYFACQLLVYRQAINKYRPQGISDSAFSLLEGLLTMGECLLGISVPP